MQEKPVQDNWKLLSLTTELTATQIVLQLEMNGERMGFVIQPLKFNYQCYYIHSQNEASTLNSK